MKKITLNENRDQSEEKYWDFILDELSETIFLFPFWKYFECIHINICSCLETLNHKITEKALREKIASDMKEVVLELVKRTLIWEFNLCFKNKKNITLKKFLRAVSSEEQLNIFFKKYPVIKLILKRQINNYMQFVVKLLHRLKCDFTELSQIFKLDNYFIQSYQINGDAHQLGGRVTTIFFENKESNQIKKMIYKPRDVGLEKGFNDFILFLMEIIPIVKLKNTIVVSKNNYGWMEYVNQESVAESDAKHYFYNLGVLLGICYILNAQDMHFENLIASGVYPTLIDLECLFSQPLTQEQYEDMYFPSVTDTLIIPNKKILAHRGLDFSCLLTESNQKSFVETFIVRGNYIDSIYIQRDTTYIVPSKNILNNELTGKAFSVATYAANIINGYRDFSMQVVTRKTEIINFIVKTFSELKNRIIFRPTFIYSKLMIESFHPKLLSSTKLYFNFLSQLNANNNVLYQTIYNHEMLDLLNGDIPYFSSLIKSTCVRNSRKKLTGFICYDSGINRVTHKITTLNDVKIAEISIFIKKTLQDSYAKS